MRRLRSGSIVFSLIVSIGGPCLWGAVNPEVGLYDFQYYSAKDYAASPENWAVAETPNGVMLFGNNDGVLEFDGVSWRKIRITNGSFARSIAIDSSGRIYVGGQGEFGYLQPDHTGALSFVSLLNRVAPSDRRFLDVWRILPTPEGIWFSSYARIFRLRPNGRLDVWRPATRFGRAFWVLGALYVNTKEAGLTKLVNGAFVPVTGGSPFSRDDVQGAVDLNSDGEEPFSPYRSRP
jgi:hypothetical protein